MKSVSRLIIILILIVMLFALPTSCKHKLDIDDAYSLLKKGIDNSSSSPFYYYKETTLKAGQTNTKKVNLLGDINSNYQPIINADGSIDNYKLNILLLQGEKTIYNLYCGKPSGESQEFLIIDSNGNKTTKATQLSDYLDSNEFKPHSLSESLLPISLLNPEDIVVNSATVQGKIALIKFSVQENYLVRYKQEYGKDSIFAGIKYAEVEIAYDRISAITTYTDAFEERSLLKVEIEPYRLHITYYGPDFYIPSPRG